MRIFKLFAVIVGALMVGIASAQTNTVTSGAWSDPTVWSPSTVPVNTTTANINHPLTIDQNISISTGTYTINASSTDFSGGTAYTLTMTGGTLTIGNGSNTPTVTFEGAAAFTNATVTVKTGATLILGGTTFNNGNTVVVESGATIIVNGTLLNSNSSGSITIGGLIYVNGNYDTNNGNLSVSGSGDLIATGTINNQGSSTTFGTNNDCSTGPCSGQNLCTGQTNSISTGNQFICSGESVTQLDANAMTGVTYQWQSSTTSGTATDFANIGGATSEDFTPSTPSVTTWYRRVATLTATPSCQGKSVAVQITVTANGGWSGNSDTNWHNSANWCGGSIPGAGTDVVINSTATRQPTISTGTASVRNLTVGSGAVITITDQTLNISGNLTYNGSFTFDGSVTGTLAFNGSSVQTISGSTPYIFNNVTFDNSSGATSAITFSGNAITVNKILTMTKGNVNLGGYNVTIGSSTSSVGALSYTAGKFYNGNITRWFSTGSVTVENVAGYFPIGTSTDSRPFYIGLTGLSTGGTLKIQHTGVTGSASASFNDSNPTVGIQRVSNSYWTLSSANGLSLGSNTYSATAGGTGLGTVSDAVNHLRLTQQGAAIGGNAGTNASSTTDLRVRRTAFTFPSNPFNIYIASSNGSLSSLPIELTNFVGHSTAEGARLGWTTVMERDFNYFGIERSSDGKNFVEIKQVFANGGQDITTNYSYVDGSVRGGRFYYRLRSVDLDGAFEYSNVVKVDLEGSMAVASIYPNPAIGKVSVDILTATYGKLLISDKQGKPVIETDLRENIQELDVHELPAGIYFAHIRTDRGQQTIKVIVTQ